MSTTFAPPIVPQAPLPPAHKPMYPHWLRYVVIAVAALFIGVGVIRIGSTTGVDAGGSYTPTELQAETAKVEAESLRYRAEAEVTVAIALDPSFLDKMSELVNSMGVGWTRQNYIAQLDGLGMEHNLSVAVWDAVYDRLVITGYDW